jgi:hypothetical protein
MGITNEKVFEMRLHGLGVSLGVEEVRVLLDEVALLAKDNGVTLQEAYENAEHFWSSAFGDE